MSVNNKYITEIEQEWLEKILSQEFPGKTEIVAQINSSKVYREYTDSYLALKFKVDSSMPPTDIKVRVPVEMRVYESDKVPIQILLHVVQGYVSELEVFRADSSKIDQKLFFEDAKFEIILNSEKNS